MADTVTTPVAQAPVQPATTTTTTAPASAPKKEEKGPDTIGTVATAPIKGKPAPEQGKKLYIVA